MQGQVMVTLRDVLEAAKLSEVDGVLNFVAFYRILRLEYLVNFAFGILQSIA